mgnify:CR=1 FL=1
MKDKMLLPNFYGIFEVKSLTKNRLRIEIDKLKNNREEINELTENLKKISVIKNFKIIQSLGSLTIEFDDSQIDAQFMLGIILKLLNLDEELLKGREAKAKTLFKSVAQIADITIYNKTKGLFDTKTLLGTGLLIYGLKKFKADMILPGGATLIWWSYRLLSKKS